MSSTLREDALVERLEQSLSKEGFNRCKIRHASKHGIGDFQSYFDYLLDCKLLGTEKLSNEAIWTNMKMQLNYVQLQSAKASEDFLKLQNKIRHLESDLEEMRSEKHK